MSLHNNWYPYFSAIVALMFYITRLFNVGKIYQCSKDNCILIL